MMKHYCEACDNIMYDNCGFKNCPIPKKEIKMKCNCMVQSDTPGTGPHER